MELKDFRFKLTNTKTGESAILSFADLWGSDDEDGNEGWISVTYAEHIPESLRGAVLNEYTAGHGVFNFEITVCDELEIEPVIPFDEVSGGTAIRDPILDDMWDAWDRLGKRIEEAIIPFFNERKEK